MAVESWEVQLGYWAKPSYQMGAAALNRLPREGFDLTLGDSWTESDKGKADPIC